MLIVGTQLGRSNRRDDAVVADFFAGLVAGTGLGILIDPRLRAYIADAQWRSGRDVGSLTSDLIERLRAPDPVETHEVLPDDESTPEPRARRQA